MTHLDLERKAAPVSDYATQNIELCAKDEEIARLKAANTDLQRECVNRGAKIADLERLLIRAADALEQEWCAKAVDTRELIDELRKAAE